MFSYFVIIYLFLQGVQGCPCSFNSELNEVSCDPDSQSSLPWILPDCLSSNIYEQAERLILQDQNFPRIVTGSFALFPNLQYLDLSYSKVETIETLAINENKKLNDVILNGNSLTSLPVLYENSDNSLETLILRHNQIKSMTSKGLDKLRYLDLEENLMTEEALSSTLAHLPNLRDFLLDSNNLVKISKTLFSNQRRLQQLSLWDNNINFIEPGAFDHISTLEYLQLKFNEGLREYRSEAWQFCNKL